MSLLSATESILDFTAHENKCRLCIREFDMEDAQIKITTAVQLRFQQLTSLSVSKLNESSF